MLESIFNHSIAVGCYAKKIAIQIGLQQRNSENALIAGLLHDIGKLVMLASFKEEMNAAIKIAQDKSLQPYVAESVILGANHGEIGAHLLSLWGLHDPILEAVMFHHNPRLASQPSKNILSAVYIANVIENLKPADGGELLAALDTNYLRPLDLIDQLPRILECLQTEHIEERVTP